MRNFYKDGYLACIKAILDDSAKHEDAVNYDKLVKQLQELEIVKDCELDDWIDDEYVEGKTDEEILSKMKENG